MIGMLDEILFDLKSPDLSTRRKALLTLIDYENISDPKRMKIIKKFLENEKDKEIISKLQNVLENFPQKQFDSLKRRIRFLKRS